MSAVDDEATAWVTRTAGGRMTDRERQDFAAWQESSDRHKGAYLRAQAIWELLNEANVVSEVYEVKTAVLPVTVKHNRRALLAGGLAASIAAAAGYGLCRVRTLKTSEGEFRKVPLPDRSLASLNSGSTLKVDMASDTRRVRLIEGEAWFEVAKNPERPFIVEAGDVRVRALGTAFSVRRKEAGAEILVTEGVVETWNDKEEGNRRRLFVGDAAFVAYETADIRVAEAPAEVERKLAWRTGDIVLDHETVGEAAQEFNRYNARKIIVIDPQVASARLVGRYRLDQPDEFAESVRLLLDVPTAVRDDSIFLGVAPDSQVDTSSA